MTYSHHPLDNKLLLGRYRMMRLLGEGGMGTVHLARVEGAEGFTRPVVVKRMRRDIRASDEGNRLFIREAKILSKLRHPGIVGIVDFGVEDGAHIMVLEYVHGYTLAPWLDYRLQAQLQLPVDICVYVVRKILEALHYAHHFDTEEGREIEIVHRDISPDNVLLSQTGYVHLLDFGIASMRGPGGGTTKSESFRGKLCYAAPETVQGKPATPLSDQYSAGIVLLEALTFETPFASDSIGETFSRMVNEEPPTASRFRSDVPPELEAILKRTLAKDPVARFESALALSRELRRVQVADDEELAEQLREMLRDDFELIPEALGIESLRERELVLDRSLSLMPPAGFSAGPSGRAKDLATVVERALPDESAPSPGALAPEGSQVAPRQLQGLLWGLLVVGGLIALGLGAAVAVFSRGGQGAEQVVVVGEVSAGQGSAAPVASVAAPLVPPSASPAVAAAHSSPAAAAKATGSRKDASKVPSSRQEPLMAAVRAQGSQFQSCFATHMTGTRETSEALLHFSVSPEGGAPRVKVEPSNIASSPLGSCLAAAARQVRFAPRAAAVSFRVPVRARVSHPVSSK